MHVLFNVSPDGLETKELYIVSNLGERTVKDAYDLDENKSATLQFPLQKDADYIFFQPDDQDRFIKQNGSFADTYPILPGGQWAQIMVSYLVPYSGQRTYTYTASVNIARMNFVLPADSDLSLAGTGITGPEPMTLQDNESYMVYSYTDLKAGQTLNVTLAGTSENPESSGKKSNNLFAAGAAFLGFALLGAGIWWWDRSDQVEQDQTNPSADQPTLDDVINEIALLDETYAEKGLSLEQYQNQRKALLQKAKSLS